MGSQESSAALIRTLESLRLRLLDTGTRNRLIHVNRANHRAKSINVIHEAADNIYAILREQRKQMRFKPLGRDPTAAGEPEDQMHLAAAVEPSTPGEGRLTDGFLETPLGPETLARKLLRIAADAKTAEEEQGANILYLAMGFLKWRESAASQVVREAPLILLPVKLVRNHRTSTYDVAVLEDDLSTNLSLSERLKQDFGITLPELDEEDDWAPSRYFAAVAASIASQSGWSIDADGMQLGFFSFSKLLMHRDLDPAAWPNAQLEQSPIFRGLVLDGLPADAPLFGPHDKLDQQLDPAAIIQVIDADASQTKVIEEVRHGSSLVVQGPPGTGKSQTITNIIAAAAHDGKTVLFVAEKMAALSVVHQRLTRSGLRDICLELHSRSANKLALLQELRRTLEASTKPLPDTPDPQQLRAARDELNRMSDLLHTPIPGITEPPFASLSTMVGLMGAAAPAPLLTSEALATLSAAERAEAILSLASLAEHLRVIGDAREHPFRGTRELALQPTDLPRLERELTHALSALQRLLESSRDAAAEAHLPAPRTSAELHGFCAGLTLLASAPDGVSELILSLFENPDAERLTSALDLGARWAEAHREAQGRFKVAALAGAVAPLHTALARGASSWFTRLVGGYRNASAELERLLTIPLPKRPRERLALVEELASVQALRAELSEEEAWLTSTLGAAWDGERTPFATLRNVATWMTLVRGSGLFGSAAQLQRALRGTKDPSERAAQIRSELEEFEGGAKRAISLLKLDLVEAGLVEAGLGEAGLGDNLASANLVALSDAFADMRHALVDRYREWTDYRRAAERVAGGAANGVLELLQAGELEPTRMVEEFRYACAEACWNAARGERPELDALATMNRTEAVERFRDLEVGRIEATKNLVLARHFDQVPRGGGGEMGIIRAEIAKKRRHLPVRRLMTLAGPMVQRIKPVLLMSPISVAQFLPPGGVTFDLLVIDEASQIRPEDALGAIARAKQIVVVGDQQQLPPTSFFDRLVDDGLDDEEGEEEGVAQGAIVAEMESILSLCEARGLRQRMLEWHYRSRDPSLIRVSNAEFYNDSLVLPPSPLQLDPDYGFKFTRVAGVYARGGSGLGRKGTNRIEAEAVAAAVAQHAREWPDLSLGVVAFSKTQAMMLTEVLEAQRRKDHVLDAFLREGKAEDLFVKNIENVQGDERDVIMISVGYGPQEPNGRLRAMSFGPVNTEGGERRLNVLFSRARVRCEVFASFDPGEIDLTRATRDGPRVLKRFLEFAQSGVIDEKTPTGGPADSPFEEDVATAIRACGYLADPQVGTAGFKIDIGVRHPDRPGQYLLAVECDGATYHSALWARERDRLRQDILEGLGWRFHRIWSTDWFYYRHRELQRLRHALDSASAAAATGRRVNGSNAKSTPRSPTPRGDHPEAPVELRAPRLTVPAYRRSEPLIRTVQPLHELPTRELAEVVVQVVEVEGPIHVEEIARRIASAFGLTRTGRRIADAVHAAIDLAAGPGGQLRREGPFLMTDAQRDHPPVRDRSHERGPLTRIMHVSPREMLAAAALLKRENGEMSTEASVREVGRLLGYARITSELMEAIGGVLEAPPSSNG
jgi:hypothetical protein